MKNYEPWPDDEQFPNNVEKWGWWEGTPYRLKMDGLEAVGNVPTPIFVIMWERNPANRCNSEGRFDPSDPGSECRWLLWDDKAIAEEEMTIALALLNCNKLQPLDLNRNTE